MAIWDIDRPVGRGGAALKESVIDQRNIEATSCLGYGQLRRRASKSRSYIILKALVFGWAFVCLSFVCILRYGSVREDSQAPAEPEIKYGFRAVLKLRPASCWTGRSLATTPFSVIGRATQSRRKQLTISRPNFRGVTPKTPTTSAAFHRSGQRAHDRPL